MTSRLPPEIYHLFIDELANSPQLLKSFSFVSHVWLSRCRTHLFRHFSLHCMPLAVHDAVEGYSECWYPANSLPADDPDAAVTGSKGYCSLKSLMKVQQIRQSIRELSLIEGNMVDCNRYKKLDFGICLSELATNIQFPNLRALAVSFNGPGPRQDCLGVTAVGKLMRIHSKLEHLCISSLYLDTHCLRNLLYSMRVCAQLSNIQLECITCAADTESWISRYSSLAFEENTAALLQWSRTPIQRLSLSDVDHNLVEVLFSPTKPTRFQIELKSLAINCSDLDSDYETMEGSVGFRLIDRHASSLQHLLLKHPKAINHAFYEPLLGTTLPFLSIIEIHFINVHDGRFRYALENLCALRSPISELRIGLKYGPRTAFTPPIDRSLINFSRSLQSLRRVRFKIMHMIDKFSCQHLPKANLHLQLEIVQGD
ncbi:hypothetical protein C8R41DRAFT_488844 [Lentinula lateritia]|uniref:F-box domain-containing protein n=1 Tax=Lentinula lateritia TaxID=40482 RepID=A0ABQ8V8R6_9AGAR|nr:hypothetical protein C8R41DRAFT_488844 [Lentinula lateritia]